MGRFGIEIVRFCVEESKSLNPEVSQQNTLAAIERNKQVLQAEGIKAMADAQAYAWDKFGELLDKHPALQQLMVVQAIYGQCSTLHAAQQATLQSIAKNSPTATETMTRLPMMGANPATFFNNTLLPNTVQFLPFLQKSEKDKQEDLKFQ